MADLSKIKVGSTVYDIKDEVARQAASGTIHLLEGTSATALTDGSDTNPINIANLTLTEPADWAEDYANYYTYDSSTHTYTPVPAGSAPTWEANTYYEMTSVTAVANDAVFYLNKELVFDGARWHEFGDMSGLGSLATKNSAFGTVAVPSTFTTAAATTADRATTVSPAGSGVATYTPAGSVSGTAVTLTAGTLPTMTATVVDETLQLNFTQGVFPAVSQVTDPTFSGTGVRLETGSILVPETYSTTVASTEDKTVTVS